MIGRDVDFERRRNEAARRQTERDIRDIALVLAGVLFAVVGAAFWLALFGWPA
jgi:hypothetical protein